jgi:putative transposase
MNIGQRGGRTTNTLCLLLGYSRQAFYQHKKVIERQVLQQELIIQRVLDIRSTQKSVGTRKLYLMLKPFLVRHDITIGRDSLFELLSANKLLIRKRTCRVPRTTFSDHWMRKYPNLIIGMTVLKANTLWVSDITYITLDDGFAYLSLVTDAYSRMILGFWLSKDLSAAGCVKALKMAIKQLPVGSLLIHHSDRGSQYCCKEYVEQLTGNQVSISMTQNSDPRENAIAERVNGILKQELLQVSYTNFIQAASAVKRAIQVYNHERLHSSVNMLTPFDAHTMTGPLQRYWKNYYSSKQNQEPMIT